MPLTDFEVQTKYADYIPLRDWRDAAVAVVAAERDAALAKLAAVEAQLAKPEATVDDVRAEFEKSDKARRRKAIQDELDKIEASKAEKQAELDKLDEKAGGPKK